MGRRRVLHVVQADVVEPVGDHDFVISEYLFGGLLIKAGNRKRRFITGTIVSAPHAAVLAAAIEKIEPSQAWELGRAMHGDRSGAGVTAFCAWLRRGGFEIEEDL